MENFEANFRPYTKEQITEGEKLPERISSITHSVGAGEKLKLDLVLENIGEVSHSLNERTKERFAILGSMSMYATLNELRSGQEGGQLLILEQRITGGKNDYDVGVHPEYLNQVMGDLGWDDEAKNLQRGTVGDGKEMVDLMGRRELPHFPWRETEIGGEKILVQSPEEMIFEKMGALIEPGTDEQGESRIGEVKWGVDIKLLKTYLMLKNGWDDAQVESHLSQKWNDYVEDTRYQGIRELSNLVENGSPVENVLRDSLQKRLGKTEVGDLRQELLNLFGEQGEEQIDSLLSASDASQFETSLRELIDLRAGEKISYEEARKKSEEEFSKIVESDKK